MYGVTKYGGDCFIQAIAKRYYIFRIPVLFGETIKSTQFVEKMLQKVNEGQRVLKSLMTLFHLLHIVKMLQEKSVEFWMLHISLDFTMWLMRGRRLCMI